MPVYLIALHLFNIYNDRRRNSRKSPSISTMGMNRSFEVFSSFPVRKGYVEERNWQHSSRRNFSSSGGGGWNFLQLLNAVNHKVNQIKSESSFSPFLSLSLSLSLSKTIMSSGCHPLEPISKPRRLNSTCAIDTERGTRRASVYVP